MKFKIDENLPIEVCKLLRAAGHDAVSVIDQKLGGQPDATIASVCRSEGRALISLDTDFGNVIAFPPQDFAGIIVIRTEDQSKSNILSFMSRIVIALVAESLSQKLWIVESNRIRIRSHE